MKNIFIEYDNLKLKDLSEKIYNLFLEGNYNAIILDNNIPINEKTQIINNTLNYFVLSNKINDENNIEIIYQLNSNDILAKKLYNELLNTADVSKYYQLRSNINTAYNYYEILNDTKKNDAIIIKYGENSLNNNNIPNIIYQTIKDYLNDNNIYIVTAGDSLYSIARRFNTSVDSIKKANNLTSNNLSIGQKLTIPSENESTNNQTIYTVVSGDSLYSIARRFNTSVDNIKKANNLTSNNLSIGQKLTIPSENESTNNQTIYTVVSGDSLYSIARRFNTSVDNIKKANNLTSNNLSIGQKLTIPSENESINNQTIYTVVSGDSLYSIARRFNTSVDNIKKANNLTSNNLSIGQKLIIK